MRFFAVVACVIASSIAYARPHRAAERSRQVARIAIRPLSPTNIGAPLVVTFEALDRTGALVEAYAGTFEYRVSGGLSTSGSVQLRNGVGTTLVVAEVAGPLEVSLRDTWHTGVDVSSTRATILIQDPGTKQNWWGRPPSSGEEITRARYCEQHPEHC